MCMTTVRGSPTTRGPLSPRGAPPPAARPRSRCSPLPAEGQHSGSPAVLHLRPLRVCLCPDGAVRGPFSGRDPAAALCTQRNSGRAVPAPGDSAQVSRAQPKCRFPSFPCIPLGDSTFSISLNNLTELQASAALNPALFWEGAKTANVKHRM